MKKVSLRASFAIIMALLVIVGLVLYVFRFVQDGEKWALYFDESTSKCTYTLRDRDGTLLATYFGGTKERNPDVCIYTQRKTTEWERPVLAADGVFSVNDRYARFAGVGGLDSTAVSAAVGPCKELGIDWEAARRTPPEYIPRLIEYQLKYEELMKEKGEELNG